jgi:hypothetical protein
MITPLITERYYKKKIRDVDCRTLDKKYLFFIIGFYVAFSAFH